MFDTPKDYKKFQSHLLISFNILFWTLFRFLSFAGLLSSWSFVIFYVNQEG